MVDTTEKPKVPPADQAISSDPALGQNAAQAAVDDEPVLEPITITLTEADGVAKPDAEEPEKKPDAEEAPRRPGRPPLRRQINALKDRLADAESRLQESERLRVQAEGQFKTADAAALAHYDRATHSAVEGASRELRDAHAAGDPDQIAKATEKLAAASSERSSFDQWNRSRPKETAKQEPAPETRRAPEPAREPVPAAVEFAKANPWIDRRSRDFDEEMANEALEYGRTIERRMTRKGLDLEDNAEELFKELDAHMRAEFPDYYEDDEPAPKKQAVPKMKAPAAPVASAARASPAASGNTVHLTSEQRQMARLMRFTYPSGHANAGKMMSDTDAERAYARQLVALRNEPQQQQRR